MKNACFVNSYETGVETGGRYVLSALSDKNTQNLEFGFFLELEYPISCPSHIVHIERSFVRSSGISAASRL